MTASNSLHITCWCYKMQAESNNCQQSNIKQLAALNEQFHAEKYEYYYYY